MGNNFQKILDHLMKDNEFKTPAKIPANSDYRKELSSKFEKYLDKLKSLGNENPLEYWIKENIDDIDKSTKIIEESIGFYLCGNAGEAYKEIQKYFESSIIKENIAALELLLTSENTLSTPLYRIRLSPSELSKRKDIFHIPFEKRHLVESLRYSVSGLPCLYLGSSLLICWEEMGRPDMNTMFISAFRITTENELKVIDLSFSLDYLHCNSNEKNLGDFFGTNGIDDAKVKAYISLFPIVLSCSFSRKHKDAKFNAEYVIPNLVLQWVSTKFDGIKYASTKVKNDRHSKLIQNYVFPPKNINKEGHCENLLKNFELTKPFSWQLLDAIVLDNSAPPDPHHDSDIRLDEELIIKYNQTKFFQIEHKMKHKKFKYATISGDNSNE